MILIAGGPLAVLHQQFRADYVGEIRTIHVESYRKIVLVELTSLAICFVVDVFPADAKCSRVASLGKMLQLRYGCDGKIESTASGITVSTKEVEASLNPTRLAFPSFP